MNIEWIKSKDMNVNILMQTEGAVEYRSNKNFFPGRNKWDDMKAEAAAAETEEETEPADETTDEEPKDEEPKDEEPK